MSAIFSPDSFFAPQLSYGVQVAFRALYGFLLFATLLMVLPHWRRFFMCEKWGGYAKSARDVDIIQSPIGTTIAALVWFGCAVALTVGYNTVLAAAVNLALCRYFFIHMRWKGVLRGMGAPGFMSYWCAMAVFLLELTTSYAPQYRPLAVLVAQVDFAVIMLSAGIYKFTAGYAQNNGMELGMVNPEWGYWWKFYKKVSPSNAIYPILNHLAWSTEVVAGVLMLIPQTRFIGAMLIFLSFIFIATQIRLGVLCEVVMLSCFVFFYPGSYGDQLISLCGGPTTAPVAHPISGLDTIVGIALWAYLALLPLAQMGLFYNFYGKKSLPGLLQPALEKYTNFFGLIIWRVFSIDVVNFYILIYERSTAGAEAKLISRYGWQGGLRYDSVAESITVTSLFTTLKYYSSNPAIFNERLLRYARTVPHAPGGLLEFDYVSIKKTASGFDYVTVAEYIVDPARGTVEERIIDDSVAVRDAHPDSPVHEGVRPGSYVGLGR